MPDVWPPEGEELRPYGGEYPEWFRRLLLHEYAEEKR
jgi:hypothetical protein